MVWTYRVFRDQKGRYSVREVFYERDGCIINLGKAPVMLVGASIEELLKLMEWFRSAFDLPVLSLEEVEAKIAERQPVAEVQGKVALADIWTVLGAEETAIPQD